MESMKPRVTSLLHLKFKYFRINHVVLCKLVMKKLGGQVIKQTIKQKRGFIFSLFLLTLWTPPVRSSDSMNTFLMSCAYGTAGGALLGLASLVFTEDPGSKFNMVARGASLGLYFGIGLGFYLNYSSSQKNDPINEAYRGEQAPLVFVPIIRDQKLDGAGVMITLVSY